MPSNLRKPEAKSHQTALAGVQQVLVAQVANYTHNNLFFVLNKTFLTRTGEQSEEKSENLERHIQSLATIHFYNSIEMFGRTTMRSFLRIGTMKKVILVSLHLVLRIAFLMTNLAPNINSASFIGTPFS